jgi:hypothetical protein
VQAQISLWFVDPQFDRTEYVEVQSITELENLAFQMKKREGADSANFELVAEDDAKN